MRSNVGEGNKKFFTRVRNSLPSRHFKNLEWNFERESPKRTISTSGRFWPLHLLSEP